MSEYTSKINIIPLMVLKEFFFILSEVKFNFFSTLIIIKQLLIVWWISIYL